MWIINDLSLVPERCSGRRPGQESSRDLIVRGGPCTDGRRGPLSAECELGPASTFSLGLLAGPGLNDHLKPVS